MKKQTPNITKDQEETKSEEQILDPEELRNEKVNN